MDTKLKNYIVKEFLKLHKIQTYFTTPLHHESNSAVEHFHSTLVEHLRFIQQNVIKNNKDIFNINDLFYNCLQQFRLFLNIIYTLKIDPCVYKYLKAERFLASTFYTDYTLNH